MSAKKESTLTLGTTASTSAANVEIFLRTVKGTTSPTDAVLFTLRSGPKSFPALMNETRLRFDELDEALSRLEGRGFIRGEGEGDNRVYHLTASGAAAPVD